jgi:hypothetical protein
VGRAWNAGGWVALVVGTLLGPEGTGRSHGRLGGGGGGLGSLEGFMPVVPPVLLRGWPGWRWGEWSDFPYFENCTVDASI